MNIYAYNLYYLNNYAKAASQLFPAKQLFILRKTDIPARARLVQRATVFSCAVSSA